MLIEWSLNQKWYRLFKFIHFISVDGAVIRTHENRKKVQREKLGSDEEGVGNAAIQKQFERQRELEAVLPATINGFR